VTRPAGAARSRGGTAAILSRAAFAALVAASVAALFIAQALKREIPLVNGHTRSIAFPGPGHRFAHFDLKTSLGGFVDVSILSASGNRPVKVIASHLRVHEYQKFHLVWNGTTTAGTPAVPGEYVVQVHFEHAGRTVIVPNFVLTLRRRAP
jgi:hypothetical protein